MSNIEYLRNVHALENEDRYDYEVSMKPRVKDWIEDNVDEDDLIRMTDDELYEYCYDKMWACDEITGNASGSYFFNAWKAENAISHNWELLQNALEDFGCEDVNILDKGPEWCDVTIRCYLLSKCLSEVIEEMRNE